MKERIKELENLICKANKAYWNDNVYFISDVEYDKLIEELKTLDPSNNLIQHIGGTKGKYRHNPPMLSLNKAYSYDEVIKWANSVSRNQDEMIFIQPKYDGLAGKIENGRLTTRGDGHLGEDITSHKNIVAILHLINDVNSPDGIIRRYTFDKYISLIEVEQPVYGELLIDNATFKEYFETGKILRADGSKYSNPRNAVAGLFNLKDISNIPAGIVTFVPYHIQSIGVRLSRLRQTIDFQIQEMRKSDNTYPLDGIVFKIHDKKHFQELGNTAHHPKGAIAFKFQNESRETTLIDIEYGMGKESITATAIFSPVSINGTTISKAVVPMQSKNLPCIMNGDFKNGSTIIVEKAGDIIPHITEIFPSEGKIFTISKCPFCNSDIELTESSVKCKNENCRKKKIHKLYEALTILGVKNIGETTVDILSKHIIETQFLEINLYNWMNEFSTPKNYLKMTSISNFGELSSQKVIQETSQIKSTNLTKFIASLCIPNVGLKIGKELSKSYSNISKIISLPISTLSQIDGVGEVMANRLFDYFSSHNPEIIQLSNLFVFEEIKQPSTKKKVCFTGTMNFPRSKMSELASQADYEVIDTVTKDLSILVVANNADLSSSKCKKAEKYGVEIIRENDFLKSVEK